MSEFKEKLPPIVMQVGHIVKSFFRYYKLSAKYNNGVKLVNQRKNDKKTMIFLINFPQAWKSVKSIYDEAVKHDDLNVLVFAVPQLKAGEDDSIDIAGRKNDAYEFFRGTDVDAIKANTEDGRWLDLRDYNPDYVIYIRSYNQYAPTMYKSYNVCQFAKCFYVPYAYGMLGDKMLSIVLPENFTFTMHKIFFANDSRRVAYAKEQPFYRKALTDRFRFLGFSRFDFCPKADPNRDYNKRNLTVAWMPRWATDDKPDQKPSHFMAFYKQFLEYFETHSDMNLIIRPHPLMFSSYISNGIMTEDEVNAFKDRCKNAPNIEIDENKDYTCTLTDSDILVADYTSLIAEFFMMGKPIIYCDSADGLNDEGSKICALAYMGENFDQITANIDLIMSGRDDLYDLRKSLIKELLPSKTGEIGKKIFEEIIND
ncbi:MAG: hypothetical protein E7306_01255 [Butyrivibrio sp.]|nr:hypothetical protein [Butyrivibrio sp.]